MISVVTGTFNEAGNIDAFIERVEAVLARFSSAYRHEIIVIDNCSTDGTREILRKLASTRPHLKVILNARNFGHVRSPYHAMMQASGDAVVAMASDLQDPPEMIADFLVHWERGAKAVVGVKEKSEESPLFFVLRRAYYRLLSGVSATQLVENFTGFGLYDRAIMDYCRKLEDPYPYFRGLISEIGLPIVRVPYRQPARKRGITKSNFFTLYDLAMLGLTNHSKVPLRLAAMLGFMMSFLSLAAALAYLVYKLLFWDSFSLGIAPVVIGLFFFSSVQLFFIGMLGEYIGAIHTHILRRPLVVEAERINF